MGEGQGPATILEYLERHASARGAAPAMLESGRPTLSYAALHAEVDRLGAHFAGIGLGRASRIAVCLPDGAESAVAMLAAMSWCACAPLNPSLDRASLESLLARLRIDALIAVEGEDTPAISGAQALGLTILRLRSRSTAAAGVAEFHVDAPGPPATRASPCPDDVALLLHTSGTTARPKIVPLTHACVGIGAASKARALQLAGDDRCLIVMPLFTGAAIHNSLLTPLAVGASMAFTSGFRKGHFVAWLREFAPTHYSAGPVMQSAIVAEIEQCREPVAHSLRFIRSGSAALPPSLEARLESAFGVPVVQGYGMAEAAAIANNPLPPGRRIASSVGLPCGNEVAIMDADGVPLPPGAKGEVVVRGPGVLQGYENDIDGTRAAFHGSWFRTGDMGYLGEGGYLFLTGRIKEQINRGGTKVSPSEVDAVLQQHPAVVDVATFGVVHSTLGEDVAAAVVLREPQAVDARDLRDFALARLAPFKVPSVVAFVDAIPRNALGKVNRATLAATLREALRAGFVAPRDSSEAMVAGFVAEVLGIATVGALDNFFELGGDSLRGAQLVARVNAATGLDLSVARLFERPTVSEFAAECRDATNAGATIGSKAIVPRHRAR